MIGAWVSAGPGVSTARVVGPGSGASCEEGNDADKGVDGAAVVVSVRVS